eukprot:SAG11_NODE_113_length_16061_cov_16.161143_10_plen_184_part_00
MIQPVEIVQSEGGELLEPPLLQRCFCACCCLFPPWDVSKARPFNLAVRLSGIHLAFELVMVVGGERVGGWAGILGCVLLRARACAGCEPRRRLRIYTICSGVAAAIGIWIPVAGLWWLLLGAPTRVAYYGLMVGDGRPGACLTEKEQQSRESSDEFGAIGETCLVLACTAGTHCSRHPCSLAI